MNQVTYFEFKPIDYFSLKKFRSTSEHAKYTKADLFHLNRKAKASGKKTGVQSFCTLTNEWYDIADFYFENKTMAMGLSKKGASLKAKEYYRVHKDFLKKQTNSYYHSPAGQIVRKEWTNKNREVLNFRNKKFRAERVAENKKMLRMFFYGDETHAFVDSFKHTSFPGVDLEAQETNGYKMISLHFHHTYLVNGRCPTKMTHGSTNRYVKKGNEYKKANVRVIAPASILKKNLTEAINLPYIKDILSTIPVSNHSHTALDSKRNTSIRNLHGSHCIADDVELPWALQNENNFQKFVTWFNANVANGWVLGSQEHMISRQEILNLM